MASQDTIQMLVAFRKLGFLDDDGYQHACTVAGVSDPNAELEARWAGISCTDQHRAKVAERFLAWQRELPKKEAALQAALEDAETPLPAPEPEQPKAVEADIPATVAEPEPESTRFIRKKSGPGNNLVSSRGWPTATALPLVTSGVRSPR